MIAFLLIVGFSGCNYRGKNREFNRENVQKGNSLFEAVGCNRCHSVSGEVQYGPALNSILHVEVLVIGNGKQYSVNVDREYIRRSIQNPDFEKVVTFEHKKMPKPELSSEEIDLLTDYIIFLSKKTE